MRAGAAANIASSSSTITDTDGAFGVGEANPSRFYGENPDTVAVVLDQFAPILEKADAWSFDAIELEMGKMWRGNGSAKSAVMSALYDLMGKRLGVPLYKMWGLDPDDGSALELHDRCRARGRAAQEGAGGGGVSDSQGEARHAAR